MIRQFIPAAAAAAALTLAAIPAFAQQPPILEPVVVPTTPWVFTKLADGQPDVSGFWGPEKQGTFSYTDPTNGGIGEVLRNRDLMLAGKPVPVWPSRIVDPDDGQIPYQPWARAKQKEIEANTDWPTKQEHLDPQNRCFPDGVVRNALWTGFQILQYPDHVVFVYDQNHTYRVIPLDGRPHPDDNIKLWMADGRGRWEGNTLVIDVTNNNSKGRFTNIGDFASDKVHITERWTFLSDKLIEYRARVTDPSVYIRPWTLWARFIKTHTDEPDWEQWEQSCHEGEKNALSSLLTPKAAAEAKARHDARVKREEHLIKNRKTVLSGPKGTP